MYCFRRASVQVFVEAGEVHRLRGNRNFVHRLSLRNRRTGILVLLKQIVLVLVISDAHHALIELWMRVRSRRLNRAQSKQKLVITCLSLPHGRVVDTF